MPGDVCYVSVSHFTNDALNILNRLNARRLFPSYGPSKLPRDWRGLANLIGITAQDAESRQENMVKWVLGMWVRNEKDAAVVHQLFRHLESIDRYDIRDDLQDLANRDRLVNTEQKWTTEDQTVPHIAPPHENDQLLTLDDVDRGAPVEYDALVLYAAADQHFVDLMINNMSEIGFKLFTKHSLRPGAIPFGPMTELISSRCRHTILVYSPAFFQSLDDRFYTDYVHARNIEKKHTIIPCVYQECTLPPQFRYYFALYVGSTAYNFWDRLARVVDGGRTPRLLPPNPTNSVRIQEITGSQLKITTGSQLKITNGPVANGQPSGPHIQVNGQPSQHASQPSYTQPSVSECVSQRTTTTIALPDVPSTALSVSVTSLSSLDSRRTETASLNDLTVKNVKKKGFLKKLLKFSKKNKKEALLTTN